VIIGQIIGGGGKRGFDLPTLVDTRLPIQANSGSGKSWLLRLFAERGIQTIVLDNEGELRACARPWMCCWSAPAVTPMYELTCEPATREPPSLEMQQRFAAMRGDHEAISRFFGTLAGSIRIADLSNEAALIATSNAHPKAN
jgi:hypothetical protein